MIELSRKRTMSIGAVLAIIAVVITAFALGGNNNSPPLHVAQAPTIGALTAPQRVAPAPAASGVSQAKSASGFTAAGTAGTAEQSVRSNSAASVNDVAAGTSSVDATRVVKTGSLSLGVRKGQVAATVAALTDSARSLGGYVSGSRTDDVGGTPTGSLTLRIPVNNFDAAVSAATKLGKDLSLSTNAADVTGKFVDLKARLSALQRTRSTYLTILGQAHTIGQTLSVQQRVNDIQQQIEQLQGELKVLRNQSSDGTLTIDVSELGATVVAVSHHRSGWSKAWHTSTGRFNRGIQAIIGGLGPLLLVLLLLTLGYVVARLSTRRLRRVPS